MNLLWIVVDCLRRDHLGCYGYQRDTSPNLDRFAAEGIRLTEVVSPHIPTQPAHTTLFTGRDVFSHQIVAQGGRRELSPEIPLLPRVLASHGYATAAVDNIGRWFEPAFEQYVHYPRWNHDGSLPWRNGEEVTARARKLLGRLSTGGRPFFLFLHYWDPHTPYLPPPPYHRRYYSGDERAAHHTSMDPVWASPWFNSYFREWMDGVRDIEYVKAEYDACIRYSDACIGELLAYLDSLGKRDDTVVIVQADHGEELDDHGCWFDHHGLYDTNVRIPVLIRTPDRRWCGATADGMCSMVDLAPTALDLIGRNPTEIEGDGRSLVGLLAGEEPGRGDIYLTECTWMRKRGWRTDRWKWIEALEPDMYGRPTHELYDLLSDPGERVNLAEREPEIRAELHARMLEHLDRRLRETGLPDPLLEQADALRIWQPRFIAGRDQTQPAPSRKGV